MRQITFILLCFCTWWATAAWANPSNSVSVVREHPDFIVSDIVGIVGNGAGDCSPFFLCDGPTNPLNDQQVLYLPQTPPGALGRLGCIINFTSSTQSTAGGQLVVWIDCDNVVTVSNICVYGGIVNSPTPANTNLSTIDFSLPGTAFRFRLTELSGTPSPAFYIEMRDCVANYCTKEVWFCESGSNPTCNIEILKECKQSDSGAWSMTMTLYYNNVPIQNTNDPRCCVTWEYVNGIPTIPCPRTNALPNINYTPMSLAEGRHYKVTITCGENCSYSEDGVVSCAPVIPKSGGADNRSNDMEEGYNAAADATNLVSIYPNPANNQLAIRIHPEDIASASYQLLLFDALGRQVLAHPLADESRWQILDISSFTPGVYAWRLINSNGERPLQTGKLLVHH